MAIISNGEKKNLSQVVVCGSLSLFSILLKSRWTVPLSQTSLTRRKGFDTILLFVVLLVLFVQ
jgi:hypothetical protein